MAMPTPMPTRCPTPMSARDREVPIAVAPLPTRKTALRLVPIALREVSRDIPAEARAPHRMILSPCWESWVPSWVSPARSTSAPATPSG